MIQTEDVIQGLQIRLLRMDEADWKINAVMNTSTDCKSVVRGGSIDGIITITFQRQIALFLESLEARRDCHQVE